MAVIEPVQFQAHVELLQLFLAQREEIVERLQSVLNAQHKPAHYLQDREALSRHVEDSFFSLAGIAPDRSRLRGQLEETHWAKGFKPRPMQNMYNDLVDPAELMRRAFHLWASTQWPSRRDRVRYAQTLFNVYLIRQLVLLSMRVWDDGGERAGDRLARIQGLLDELWNAMPADQPVLVRDARWLIPLALSAATEELAPYFAVAENIAGAFSDDDRVGILEAVVRLAGGHLRSYVYYYITQKRVPLNERRLVLVTRKSNALDFSLLIHGLVPLLEAYEHALDSGNDEKRHSLADAICQGISPDPELFINGIDLLGAYSMVEHLFTTADAEGHVIYTPLGQHHVTLLEGYAARIARVAKPLHTDCLKFRPVAGSYSPYGVIYGFSSNLLEHMVLKAVQRHSETRFSLEDVFREGDSSKLDWVNGWRKLPHVDRRVAKLYAYPQSFAEATFGRVERALRRRADDDAAASTATRIGRLFIEPEDDATPDAQAQSIPDLPLTYIGASDGALVAARKAQFCEQAEISSGRLEGYFLVSYETPGGWVAISKDLLTEVLGAGRDAKIAGLPSAAAERLRLMCRDLIAR